MNGISSWTMPFGLFSAYAYTQRNARVILGHGVAAILVITAIPVSRASAPVTTTTTLTSSQNPLTYGQSVTFTATVSSLSGTPVGRVTFKNGSAFLGSATLTAGVAIITTAVVGAGTRSITAVYNGTAAFTGSTSSVLSQVVDQAATTTALTSSQNPSTYGQSVTFIATVSSSYAGTPSGKVTFKVGKTVLGSGSLSGGAASYTTSVTQLAGGTTSVIATYSGGVNFSGSTSGAYSQTVSPAPTTNVLTSSLNPANTGQGVTLTTTLNSTAGTPSGNVEFLDGTTTIGVVALKSG